MSLEERIQILGREARNIIEECASPGILEELHNRYLGKKGELTLILKGLKDLSPEERKTAGHMANRIREELGEALASKKDTLIDVSLLKRTRSECFDALQPNSAKQGHMHPLSAIQYQVEDIFTAMGFQILDGPEVETDEYNFGKLNFSEDHPARDMQDTLWTLDGNLLRTHTSPVQIRAMEILEPPFRILVPGRVYRYEELDASHENTFYQVEGMMVGHDISVANLIAVTKNFLSAIFERSVLLRVRPGYFPFVEPGFEIDIGCLVCDGKGCSVCKHSAWVELLPCGLIHPNVLQAGGIDPKKWSGFAFGLGLSRLAMMKHGIEDIRHFLSGNLRFLNQF